VQAFSGKSNIKWVMVGYSTLVDSGECLLLVVFSSKYNISGLGQDSVHKVGHDRYSTLVGSR
jgi:hypothetical protein